MKSIVGLYDDFETAQNVVKDLVNAGFDRANISVLANDAEGRHSSTISSTTTTETDHSSGAASGAAGGAVVGGIGGLLLGLGALAIPGLGPIIAAGPIVAALTGAGIGAAAGGVLGALTDLGVPDEEAEYYAEGVRRGGTLVTLKTSEDLMERAIDIMDNHGAVDIQDRVENWKQTGWNGFNPNEQHYTPDQVTKFREEHRSLAGSAGAVAGSAAASAASGLSRARTYVGQKAGQAAASIENTFDKFQDGYRTHYDRQFASTGRPYDTYQPAYKYGYELANNKQYASSEWPSIEADARRDWDARGQGPWEDFKDAVKEGYQNVKSGAKELYQDTKDVVREGYQDTKDVVREGYQDTKDTLRRADAELDNIGSPRTTTVTTFEKYQPTFRSHYDKQFASSGRGFDTYQPAYKYGFDLASDQRYTNSEWPSIEADARRDWDARGQGPWEDFKDAVKEGYQNVKSGAKELYQDTKDVAREGYQDTKDAARRNL